MTREEFNLKWFKAQILEETTYAASQATQKGSFSAVSALRRLEAELLTEREEAWAHYCLNQEASMSEEEFVAQTIEDLRKLPQRIKDEIISKISQAVPFERDIN